MATEQDLTTEIESAVSATEVESKEEETKAEETEETKETGETEETKEVEEPEETEETKEVEESEEAEGDGETKEAKEGDEEDKGQTQILPDGKVEPIASTPSRLSDEVLTRAARAGLSVSDAREFGSEAALLRVVDSMEAKAAPGAKDDPLDSLPKLDPEQYDEDVIKTFDTLKDVVRGQRDQIELLMSGQTHREQMIQNGVTQELEQWFDGSIEKLGEDFAITLGKGGHASLKPGSSQLAKRESIADQIGILKAGYEAAGREAPSRDELFNTATRSILGDEFQTIRDRKITDELKSRRKQHIARPGSVKVKQERPVDEEVAASLDEKYFSN